MADLILIEFSNRYPRRILTSYDSRAMAKCYEFLLDKKYHPDQNTHAYNTMHRKYKPRLVPRTIRNATGMRSGPRRY